MSTVKEGNLDDIIEDEAYLRIRLIKLSSEFNHVREELFNMVHRYYRQSIGSTYTKENNIEELLTRCKKIKQEYQDIQKKILKLRPNDKSTWRDHEFVYRTNLI